jgi:hypothetical protein
MNNQIITFSAQPAVTRWTYLKTALIMFVVGQVLSFFAQSRLVQEVDFKYSFILSTVLSLIIAYFLSRLPLTQSLTIDYGKRLIIIGFATLTKAHNTLEIPFDRLGLKTDMTSDPASSDRKWKMSLLLDGKEVYLLLSSENGFSTEQMNEFNERVSECN